MQIFHPAHHSQKYSKGILELKMSLLRSSYNNFIVRTLLGMWADTINWHRKIWWFSHFLTMCCCNQIFKTECFDYRNFTNLQCTQQIKAICQVCRSDPLRSYRKQKDYSLKPVWSRLILKSPCATLTPRLRLLPQTGIRSTFVVRPEQTKRLSRPSNTFLGEAEEDNALPCFNSPYKQASFAWYIWYHVFHIFVHFVGDFTVQNGPQV